MNGCLGYMVKFQTSGLEDEIARLEKLGHSVDGAMTGALFEGAGVLADAIRSSGQSLGVSEKVLEGLYIAEFNKGYMSVGTEIGFTGYFKNSKGKDVARALVAACYESGTSDRRYPKNAFIRKALKTAKEQVLSTMQSAFDSRMK